MIKVSNCISLWRK